MDIELKVDETRKPPFSLDFGVCELSPTERAYRRRTTIISIFIFLTSAATAVLLSRSQDDSDQ